MNETPMNYWVPGATRRDRCAYPACKRFAVWDRVFPPHEYLTMHGDVATANESRLSYCEKHRHATPAFTGEPVMADAMSPRDEWRP